MKPIKTILLDDKVMLIEFIIAMSCSKQLDIITFVYYSVSSLAVRALAYCAEDHGLGPT